MRRAMNNRPGEPAESRRAEDFERFETDRPLAVLLIGGESDLGLRSFRLFEENYRETYDQILFVSVGESDPFVPRRARDRGESEERELLQKISASLDPYVAEAHALGMMAATRIDISPDPIQALDALGTVIMKQYPKSVFFLSKLAFKEPRWFQPLLFGESAEEIRKRLRAKGCQVIVLPVVI